MSHVAALRVFSEIEHPLDEFLSVSAIVQDPSFRESFCRWLSDNRNPVTAWGRFT